MVQISKDCTCVILFKTVCSPLPKSVQQLPLSQPANFTISCRLTTTLQIEYSKI